MKKYNSVQDLFTDLPNTVLLVGNGKSKNKGTLIDSYDFVIRFNDFQIEGYESDVGSKVDAVSFHCSDFTFKHTSYMLPTFEKYVNKVHLFTTSDFCGNSKREILHLQPSTRLLSVSHRYMQRDGGRLSSGCQLALNLTLFFNKNVHMIGFDGYKTGHYYDPTFDVELETRKAGLTTAHNHEYEFEMLSKIKTVFFI
jgi:hypothetical protein